MALIRIDVGNHWPGSARLGVAGGDAVGAELPADSYDLKSQRCRGVSPGRRFRNPTNSASGIARSGWRTDCRPLVVSHLRSDLSPPADSLLARRRTAGSSCNQYERAQVKKSSAPYISQGLISLLLYLVTEYTWSGLDCRLGAPDFRLVSKMVLTLIVAKGSSVSRGLVS